MSNKENKTVNQPEGKKILKFILGMIGIYLVGFLFGIGGAFAEDILRSEELINTVENVFSAVVPVVFVVLNLGMFAISMAIYFKAKKMADNWDGEDEEVIDTIEKKLNIVTVACNIVMVCNCFFFGAMVQIGEVAKGAEVDIPFTTFTTTAFLVSLGLSFIVAKLVVDLIKRLNPERRSVSVFDMNFEKKWEESSDEAQKQIMYRAGYATYKMVNMVCTVMWGITLFAQLIYKTGVFPMACVCIIWGACIGTYSIVSAKLESGSTFKPM